MYFQNKPITEDLNHQLLGAFLRYHREEESMSLSFMAEILKISKSYLSDIEHGKRMPAPYALHQILKVLDVPYQEIAISLLEQQLYEIYEKFAFFTYEEGKQQLLTLLKHKEYEFSNGFVLYRLLQFLLYCHFPEAVIIDREALLSFLQAHSSLLSQEMQVIYEDLLSMDYARKLQYEEAEQCLITGLANVNDQTLLTGMLHYHFAAYSQLSRKAIQALQHIQESTRYLTKLYCQKRVLFLASFEANVYAKLGYLKEAEEKYLELIKAAQAMPYQELETTCIQNLLWIYYCNGKYQEAEQLFAQLENDQDLEEMIAIFQPVVLYRNHKLQEALRCIEQVASTLSIQENHLFLEAMQAFLKEEYALFEQKLAAYCVYLEEVKDDDTRLQCFYLLLEYYEKIGNSKQAYLIQKQILPILANHRTY